MRIFPLLLSAFLLFGCLSQPTQEHGAVITLPGGFVISADIASTHEEQAQGLSGRPSLSENEGMLFIYTQPSRPGFWMPGMNFPLDILFLDENFTVVDSLVYVQPCPSLDECPPYWPSHDCIYVLEICANCSIRHNATVGSRLSVKIEQG